MKLMVGSAGALYNGSLYFCPVQYNALCRTDLNTGKTEVIGYFELEEKQERLYKKAYFYNECIWFIPWKADRIVCFNTNTHKKEYFDSPFVRLSNIGVEVEKCAYLSSGVYKDRYLFLVPTMYDTPVVIDMETHKIQSFHGVLNVEEQAYGYGTIYNDEFWMTPHTGNSIIRLNILDKTTIEMPWPYNTLEYRGMCSWDNKVWFSPGTKSESILYYDVHNEEFRHVYLDELFGVNDSYNECIPYEDGIVFLPYESNHILYVSKFNHEYRVSSFRRDERFFALRRMGVSNGILMVEENDNLIYEWTPEKSIRQVCEVSMGPHEKGKIMLLNGVDGIINENKYRMEDFIEYVKG